MQTLLLKKAVDKSLLKAGLTVPVSSSAKFMQALRLQLKRGEKFPITIIVDGISYSALFTHVDIKAADREIFQIRYPEGSPLGKKLRNVFSSPVECYKKQCAEIWSVAANTIEFKCFSQMSTLDLKDMKQAFFEYLGEGKSLQGYVKSYKLVFYLCYFHGGDLKERIRTDVFTRRFLSYYKNRTGAGLKAETDSNSILFYPESCSERAVYQLIINNPFKAISQNGYFKKEVIDGSEYFAIAPELYRELTKDDIITIKNTISKKLTLYYSRVKKKGKREMPMVMENVKKLKQKELHSLFIEDIKPAVLNVGDLQKKPLIIELASPFLCRIKVYMFNCTCPPGGRKPDEFKSQLILDGQKRNERGYLDDTDGTFILLVGYAMPYGDQANGVYVLWDAEEHRTFAYSANLQTKLDSILETAYEDVVLQTRKSGEIVVLSSRKNLTAALSKRLQLYADRLLGEH